MPDTSSAEIKAGSMLSPHTGLPAKLRDLSVRAKTQIDRAPALAREQWGTLPDRLLATVERVKTRVRDTLEIPSRQDLADLADRIEAVDARLAQLAARPAPAPAPRETAAATEASEAPAEKTKAPAQSKKSRKTPPAAAKTTKAKAAKKSPAKPKKPAPKRRPK